MISIIVAIAENNAIGRNGDLLCHMSADLKHFKAVTTGHPVVMGRATYLSLPRRPLPNRRNIVLTTGTMPIEGAEVVHTMEEALAAVQAEEEAFIIGGGQVYRQMMPMADKLYVTHIDATFPDADTFFPAIDPEEWTLVSEEKYESDESNPYPYRFCEYLRR